MLLILQVYCCVILGPAPWDDLAALQTELNLYKPGLTARPSLIAANKADISLTARANLEILKTKTDLTIVPISAKMGVNVEVLTGIMRRMVEIERAKEEASEDRS